MADKEQPGAPGMCRVGVYITEEQWVNLRRAAVERSIDTREKVTVSTLVRDALKRAGYGD